MVKAIKIIDIIGKSSAVLHSDGLKLYNAIVESYKQGNEFHISFSGLAHCTTAFLNASIGKYLLSCENPDEAVKNIKYLDLPDESVQIKINQVQEISLNEKKRVRHDELVREEFCA